MSADRSPVLGAVGRYYTEKIERFGATPAGVDWNGSVSQELRFSQLLRIVDSGTFSINDVGCGFGSLVEYLDRRGSSYEYVGVDVSEAMVARARALHAGRSNRSFEVSARCTRSADYSLASGIFNVRLDVEDEEWMAHILETLSDMNRASRVGFAFNCLTKYSDPEYMRDHLFYADPCLLFDYCKRTFSRNVALLHDYGLYEFTILVRKAV